LNIQSARLQQRFNGGPECCWKSRWEMSCSRNTTFTSLSRYPGGCLKDSGSALTRGDVLYESQVRCSALGKNIARERLLLKNSPISLNLPLPSTTNIIRATTATTTAKMALYSCLLSGIKEYAKTHVRTEPPNHAERGAPVYSAM
jgi:hypothetical protein